MSRRSSNGYSELKNALREGDSELIINWLNRWSTNKSKIPRYYAYYQYLVEIGCPRMNEFVTGYKVETNSGENWTCSTSPGLKECTFKPDLSPDVMLRWGVFGGSYILGWEKDIPIEWIMMSLIKDKIQLDGTSTPDCAHNKYGVCSYQNLEEWEQKGWLCLQDPLGWFQWYIRYYLGRRTDDDERQKRRWKFFKRHLYQIFSNPGEPRIRQRQCCIQWGYNPNKSLAIY
jgi:hypothetical protein